MKSLFALAFISGASIILLIKIPESRGSQTAQDSWYTAVAVVAPVLIICAYAAIVGSQPKARRSASDADNLYYLGFLFTIVSLGATLVGLKDGSSLAENLITSFGVALSTTIVGLFLRTLLLPHNIDIGQQDEAIKLQLHDATEEFIKALSRNTSKLDDAFDDNTARIADAFKAAVKAVGVALPREADKLTQTFELFNAQTDSSLKNTLKEIQQFPIAIKQTTENLAVEHSKLLMDNMRVFQDTAAGFMEALKTHNEQIGKVGTAIERLRTRIDEVRVDPELLAGHVTQVYGIYQNAADAAAAGFTSSSEAFAQALASYTTSTEQHEGQIVEIAAAMAQLHPEKVQVLIDQALQPMSAAVQALNGLVHDQARVQQTMNASVNALVANLRSQSPTNSAPSGLNSLLDDTQAGVIKGNGPR